MSVQHVLARSQIVPAALPEVCDFFENPGNLGEITPPFLNFQIKTEGPIQMKQGELIDYTIRLHGVPMLWRTRIESYVPGVEFVDFQLSGPYKYWHHLHTFRETEDGTEIGDTVTYQLPLGKIGEVAHALFVRRQLETIFNYRAAIVQEKFGRVVRAA